MYYYRRGRYGRELRVPDAAHGALLAEVLRSLVGLLPAHPAAHGWVRDRSVETALCPHIGCRYLQMLDIRDCFSSITRDMVEDGLAGLGVGEVERAVVLDLCLYHDHLPAGACTSPALCNVALWMLDSMLSWQEGVYTRYCDNLLRSSASPIDEGADRWCVRGFGLRLNEAKSLMLVRGRHAMTVMGWTVGETTLRPPRSERRRRRAVARRLEQEPSPEGGEV